MLLIKKIVWLINVFSSLPNDAQKLKKFRNFIKYFLSNPKENLFIINHPGYATIMLSDYYQRINSLNAGVIETNYPNTKAPRILIVSHEFSLTGAPKAALMLAKTLNSIYNVSPVVMTLKQGPIEEEFRQNNIPLIDFCYEPDVIRETIENFDIVILNSCSFKLFENLTDVKVPVIWWIHENFTSKHEIAVVKKLIPKIHSCWAGSPLSKKYFEEICSDKKCDLMLYGLDRINIKNNKQDKSVFSVMGTIEPRKGTDIFIEAVKMLPENIREKSIFYVIGGYGDDKSFAQKVKTTAADVRFVDSVPFEQLLEYYAISDAIVVPSRSDPMPIVATYAFMFSKLCVCSDSIGTALLVENNQTGVLFENENARDLSEKISDIVTHPEKYDTIAKNGYKIYEKYFSQKIFKENLENKINDIVDSRVPIAGI